jgi:hypothetical protein
MPGKALSDRPCNEADVPWLNMGYPLTLHPLTDTNCPTSFLHTKYMDSDAVAGGGHNGFQCSA